MAILDSTIVKGDLTVTGTIRGLGGNSSGGGSSIEQVTIGASSLVVEDSECKVVFSLNSTTSALYAACPLIIFTMNNSFITTPQSQVGTMLCCGSFAYDSSGNTRVVRVRIVKSSNAVTCYFDDGFKNAIGSSFRPDAYLLGIKF